MYVIKVRFPSGNPLPQVQIIDSALTTPEWENIPADVVQMVEQYCIGYPVNRDSFSLGIARSLAANVLCSVGVHLRYQYTDGFLPDATFVFEYDR